jgi:lactoylglutathione lyase
MSGTTLAAILADWTDVDFAAHALARSLGLMPDQSAMSDAKWVYWSNNPVGSELIVLLDRLTALGFLEKREEPDIQYRLRPEFQANLNVERVWQQVADKHPEPGLTLVVLRCADLERSKEFYETLTLSLNPEHHGSGPSHYSARLGETVLELYPAGATPGAPIRLGVAVPDLRRVVGALRVLGDFVITFDSDHSPLRALVRDPDGNKIELTGE